MIMIFHLVQIKSKKVKEKRLNLNILHVCIFTVHFNKCKPDLRPDISCFSYFLHSFDYCNYMTVMINWTNHGCGILKS